jgi:hypothetical protein
MTESSPNPINADNDAFAPAAKATTTSPTVYVIVGQRRASSA